MKNKRLLILILFAFVGMTNGFAQEYLTGFYGVETAEESQKSREVTVATLPFFDDFTKLGFYPDETKWQSKCVFVNSGFPKMPVNYRAATFDMLDQYGKVYSNGSSNPFIADSLISVRIRLDSVGDHALSPADSVYFSFYYQAGGYGDCPERDDSLVLQFGYRQDDKIAWKQVWAAEGGEYTDFNKVMIPIVDECLFSDEFYILFFNYGTLPTTMYPNDRSNMDQWNIDFVYLDMNRSVVKDFYPSVNFTNVSPSFLNRYRSMPYKHFKDNPLSAINNDFTMFLTNLDANAHEVKYSCEVTDNNTGWNYTFENNPTMIQQYSNVGVDSLFVRMDDFIYPYNSPLDTTSFTIKHYVDVVDKYGGVVAGDTMTHHQGFYNYFAYDDGTPEMGYGLVPDDTYFAAQFNITRLDTLSGVQLLFNRTLNDANLNFFDIVVWRDNNGKPGEIIYTLEDQRPSWDDSLIYKFSYYKFDEVVKVNSIFYVGIRQQYSKTINIGFDSSADNHQYNFYDAGEGWKNSSFPGSLMIRPIMGKKAYFVGVDENQEVNNELALYPNPAQSFVRIANVDENLCKEILIYDMTGRVVKNYPYCNELNVSDLNDGVYMMRAVNADGSCKTSKLLISK